MRVDLLLEQFVLGCKICGHRTFQFPDDLLVQIGLIEQMDEHIEREVDQDAPYFVHQHFWTKINVGKDIVLNRRKQKHKQQSDTQSPEKLCRYHIFASSFLCVGRYGIDIIIPDQ